MKNANLLLVLLMAGLLFMLFSRTRRQQREAQKLQTSLSVGAEVMTTAGLYATVVELPDGAVVLETGPGQTSRWDRRAIARVIPPAEPVAVEAEDRDDEPVEASVDGSEPDVEPRPARASAPEAAPVRRSEASMYDTEDEDGDVAAAGSVAPSQEKPPSDRA